MSERDARSPRDARPTNRRADLLRQYGCGPVELTGSGNALSERHLLFDNVVDPAATGAREQYEALALSVRDVFSQRWVRTEQTYESVKALAAPLTVNTMPEGTLKALADHGELGAILPADGGDGEEVLAQFAKAGVDVEALASQLQDEGAKAFVKSWHELMEVIVSKSADLGKKGIES
jgi:hypothetical protein